MSWSKTDRGFTGLPRKIRDQIKHVTFGGSPGEERALITTLDGKLHISSANFLSNDQGRNVTSLPDNITHAALNWNNTLAQVRRTSGGRGNMPVRRHQVHSRVQRGRAEQVRLVVTSIENGLFTSTPTTCKLPSEGDIVLIQWISVDELVIVVKQNSEYQIFFWCTTLKHEYTLITRTLVGEEETIFSDFIISPDGKYNLLVSNIGMLLFSSDTEDDNPTLPLVVRKIDAEAASFMNSGGPSSVLVTATFERPVITVTARELLSPNSDNTIRVLGRTFEHEIPPLNSDEVGVMFLHFLQGGTGILLTENTLYGVNIDPSLMHLTTPFAEFTDYDISRAVHIRSSESSSPNTNTLYALAFEDKTDKKTALFCTLTVHYDTTPSESSVTGNHSTLSNENETLSTSSNNGLQPPAPLVSVASPSGSTANKGSTANNGPPLEPPAKTPEKFEAEKLNSSEDEDNVSDSRTAPQNNSDRGVGVDVSPSTLLEVTQRSSSSEFPTKVSQGMDPPENEDDLLENNDIGRSAEGDASAVDSGEEETHSSKSEDPTTNGNANTKVIASSFEVNDDDDDATKSSRSSSPAGSTRAYAASADIEAGGEAKSIGAPKSVDDGLEDSQLSSSKSAGSPLTPLPSTTKSSSFELDNASVASDGSKAIESTTSEVVGVPPQDESAILPSPEKQTPPHHHLRQRETVVSHIEKPEEPRLPRMNRLQVAQDSSINLNTANSEQQPLGGVDSSRSSLSHYDADEEENEDDDNEEEDVDQDRAEESSISDHDQDVELGREKDGNALSEDEQVVVAATLQRPDKGLAFTGTSDSDETVPWNSDDETRQQQYLQSLKGEDHDESSEDDEDLDEDDAEKSSGENGRVLNVASPPPEAVAKMEVISISSGSPPSDGDDGFIVDETEKATIREHVDEVYRAFNIIHPNDQMTVQHTQLLVAQRLRIAREDLGVEREDLVKQRMEHLLRDHNDDVENEVAGSALENRQGNVPRGVQHDSDAISVYSSSDDDGVSSSTNPTDQQILDLVNVLFQQADPDKVKVTDIQRQVANHFRLGDRNALGDDRKTMIKEHLRKLVHPDSTDEDDNVPEDEDDDGEQSRVSASSSSSSGYVQSNESESEGDEEETEGNNRREEQYQYLLTYSGPWKGDANWWHQTKKYPNKSTQHILTTPGRFKFRSLQAATSFRNILQGEAYGIEAIALGIFNRQGHQGFAGSISQECDDEQRKLIIR